MISDLKLSYTIPQSRFGIEIYQYFGEDMMVMTSFCHEYPTVIRLCIVKVIEIEIENVIKCIGNWFALN